MPSHDGGGGGSGLDVFLVVTSYPGALGRVVPPSHHRVRWYRPFSPGRPLVAVYDLRKGDGIPQDVQ